MSSCWVRSKCINVYENIFVNCKTQCTTVTCSGRSVNAFVELWSNTKNFHIYILITLDTFLSAFTYMTPLYNKPF